MLRGHRFVFKPVALLYRNQESPELKMTKEEMMSKYNTADARSRAGVGPVKSTTTTTTFGGIFRAARDEKSELFLAAVSDFGGESSFYETADARVKRISALVHTVALSDLEWLKGFTFWLRNEANMRTVAYTIALEGAVALHKAGKPGARQLVAGSLLRADEPGEALAWWMATQGRKIPSAVKRGIADAFVRSTNEFSLARYDTSSHGFRFGDIIELVHPKPKDGKQSELFKHALDRRRNAGSVPSESLTLLNKRAELLALSPEEKRAVVLDPESTLLKDAGATWELLGSTISGGMDAKAWEAVIPSMGYMALLRNLRNFEEKGVSKKVLDGVATRLADPEQVAKSRQLPFRFLSAYRAVTGYVDPYSYSPVPKSAGSLRFVYPLEQALDQSLANVPELDGDTLILVDRSGSMYGSPSKKTQLNFADSAAVFGTALALRANKATLVEFGSGSNEIKFAKSDSMLKLVESFKSMGGTSTARAVQAHYKPGVHTRVIIITDEQTTYGGDPLALVGKNVPCYTWNLAGYRTGQGVSGPNRTYLGGLSDQAFKLIPMVESGRDAGWDKLFSA